MLRRIIIAGVATCAFGLTLGFSQSANAQTAYCWINAKTGTPVPTSQLMPEGSKFDDPEHNHASITGPISGTFGTYVRGPDGSWSNAATGQPVPNSQIMPEGSKFDDPEHNHASITGPISGTFGTYVRVPCPPTDASTMPPMQTGVLPGGTLLPGGDKGGTDTPDKPGGDTKTPDTKTTDTKAPTTPVKDDKPKQAAAPKTPQTENAATAKDKKLSKSTTEKQNSKATKKLTGPKTVTAHKTTKSAATKTKEKRPEGKTQVHIEFFSTGGRMGGGGFGH
jgi:hypothetical protein